MKRYGWNWMIGIWGLCMMILIGLPTKVRAETAGMTVTAVKEKDAQEPSSEETDKQDDEPGDEEDDEPGDDPVDQEDGEPDDKPENTKDDRPGNRPEENRPDDTPEYEEDDSDDDDLTTIMIGLIGVVTIMGVVSGLWNDLWGLLLCYLFRKRKAVWHGILTEEENRFIRIVPASEDYPLAQEIINYSSDPTEAYGMLEETGDVTYLPKFCRVWVSFQTDGDMQVERLRCDERQVYEFMENLGDVGDKMVLIESRATDIRILLVYP